MGEESLVARLRAHVEGDDGSWHWEDTDALLREAADALERAEKERDEARDACAEGVEFIGVMRDELVLRGYPGGDRAVMLKTIRALSPSTKDETNAV